MRRWWVVGGAGVIGLGVGFAWLRRTVWPPTLPGRKVTSTAQSDDGWIFVRPAELAARAGLDVETYTLARILGSEDSAGRPVEKASMGWAVVNEARRRGWSLLRMATNTTRFGDQGYYGSQEHGRFASTARDPTDRDVAVAKGILTGRVSDPTRGADKFFDPETQDALHVRRPDVYVSAAEIVSRWTSEGRRLISVFGVRPRRLALFRPVRVG